MNNIPLDSTDLTWLAGLARALLGESSAADDLLRHELTAPLVFDEGTAPLFVREAAGV